MDSFFSLHTLKQFFGYGAVGILNTALSFVLINIGIWLTGKSSGPIFIGFSFATFFVLVIHSFVWNRYLIFKRDNPRELHREYFAFFIVSGSTALLNLFILHVLVDVVGAPAGLSPHLWANVAVAFLVPVSVTCNFLGYKLYVFKSN